MRLQNAAAGLLAVVGAFAAGACSVALMERTPETLPEEAPPRCSEKEGWPIWDSALGTSTFLVGGLQLSVAHDTGAPGVVRAIGIANLVVGGAHLASAVAGYGWAEDCREAVDAFYEARGEDPRGDDPRGREPRGEDPRGEGPRGDDPRGEGPSVPPSSGDATPTVGAEPPM